MGRAGVEFVILKTNKQTNQNNYYLKGFVFGFLLRKAGEIEMVSLVLGFSNFVFVVHLFLIRSKQHA